MTAADSDASATGHDRDPWDGVAWDGNTPYLRALNFALWQGNYGGGGVTGPPLPYPLTAVNV